MSNKQVCDSTKAFEQALVSPQEKHYMLRLYIAGAMPQSVRAIANVKKICEEYLQGRYELEVIDLYQQPQLAHGDQIIAVPTLIRKLPPPCAASSAICQTPSACWRGWIWEEKRNAN